MICKRCGAEFSGDSFCPQCGAPAVEAESPNNNATVVAGYDEPTVLDASEEATVIDSGKLTEMSDSDAMVAARDFDATVAAPVLGVNGVPKAESDKKSAKKANKEPKPLKKKIIAAVAAVLAVVIALGAVAAGVVAFTPKYKLMIALGNTLLDTKSFEFNAKIINEHEYHSNGDWVYDDESYNEINVDGAIAFGKTTAETSFFVEAEMFNEDDWYEEQEDYYYDEWTGEQISSGTSVNSGSANGTVTYYAVSDNGKAIAGYVDDYERSYNGDYSEHNFGAFLEGNLVELVDYAEGNVDEIIRKFGGQPERFRSDFEEVTSVELETAIEWVKTLISKKKINEDVIEAAFNGALKGFLDFEARIDLPEYKEAKKLISDFLMNGLSKEAVKITDTRIEDGMTKYDIAIDVYEVIKSFEAFVEENQVLEDLLNDIDRDLLREIGRIRKSDLPEIFQDDIEFTVGTKNMRIVYFNFEIDLSDEAVNRFSVEINFTNVNKKLEFGGHFDDVDRVAAEWKENRYYIKDVDDLDRWI